MPDSTSPDAPHPDERTPVAQEHERVDRFEILVAVLLGLAATLTAWAAFQGGLLGGDSQKEFTKAALSSDQAGQYWNLGNQRLINDQALFREFATAAQEGNEDLSAYLMETLMDENLQGAVEWWGEQEDESILSPFDDVEGNPYETPELEEGERLDEQSVQESRKGDEYDTLGDKFDGVTVLLATALFLFGLAAVYRGKVVRRATLGVGGVLLLVSVVRLIDLGVYQWTA